MIVVALTGALLALVGFGVLTALLIAEGHYIFVAVALMGAGAMLCAIAAGEGER